MIPIHLSLTNRSYNKRQMRNWDLQIENPFLLTLSADSRFCNIDLYDDQIWELSLAGYEPRSIMMHTTYGLRAQSMSVFPRFLFNEQTFTDPISFSKKPTLQYFLSNYINLNFCISPEINCSAEYWVPDSHTIAGSYQFHNTGNKVVTIQFELCANLKPLNEGDNISPVVMGDSAVLTGKTYNLVPVCAMSGVSQINDSPFPSLWQNFQIVPGKNKTLYWALSSLTDVQSSLEHAREILASPWEAQIARVLMVNDSQEIEIHTGDPDWDLAFAASQRSAFSLVMDTKSGNVPFVKSRRADMGYSFAEEGKGVIAQWKKPSAFDAYYLTGILLPGGADLVQNILTGFLQKYQPALPVTKETTRRSFREILDQPILCTMAWDLFNITNDKEWLHANIDALASYFDLWFTPDQDKDLDGFPEWQNIEQSGLEINPIFERWNGETQGLNIRTVESPSLPAFLYQECQNLIRLIHAANRDDLLSVPEKLQGKLKEQLNECWNERFSGFFYRDFETHITQIGKNLLECHGNGLYKLNMSFSRPQRLLIQIVGKDDTRRRFQIQLSGQKSGETIQETIDFFNISWLHGRSYYTCNNLFTRLDTVEITGMSPDDQTRINTAHHQMSDISTLLPIWAGALENHRANKIIEKNLHKQYWGTYGIPVTSQVTMGQFTKPSKVLIPWNQLLGQGLLTAGKQEMAVQLVTNLMEAIKQNFLKYHEFQEEHDCETAQPSGEVGNLRGFAPKRLFLDCLGVQYIEANHLFLNGQNLFPWPVTVKYKGVTLTRHKTDTVITFSTGQTITVTGNEAKEIKLTTDDIIDKKEYYG